MSSELKRVSDPRREANATYPADLMTVEDHGSLDVGVEIGGGSWLARPTIATHIKMQALTQNVRYRIDGGQATATVGFQLVAGADTLAPVPNLGISLCAEVAGAVLQYQFCR